MKGSLYKYFIIPEIGGPIFLKLLPSPRPPFPPIKKPKKIKNRKNGGTDGFLPAPASVSQSDSQAPRQTEFDGVRVREGKKILVAIAPLWCFRFPGTFRSTLGKVEIPISFPEFFTIPRTNFFSFVLFFCLSPCLLSIWFGCGVSGFCLLYFGVLFLLPSFLPSFMVFRYLERVFVFLPFAMEKF